MQKAVSALSVCFMLCMVLCPLAALANHTSLAATSCHGASHPDQQEGQTAKMQCCTDRAITVSEVLLIPPLPEETLSLSPVPERENLLSLEATPYYRETGRFLASLSILRV